MCTVLSLVLNLLQIGGAAFSEAEHTSHFEVIRAHAQSLRPPATDDVEPDQGTQEQSKVYVYSVAYRIH